MLGVGRGAEDPIIGRRDPRLPHQVLGKDLAPLQLGRLPPRAENAHALPLEDVDDALDERLLGTDNGQADPLAFGELDQPAEIARLDRDVLHIQGGAGVPRSAEDRGDARRLLELPAKSVLTPSLADDEDFQRLDPHSPEDPGLDSSLIL